MEREQIVIMGPGRMGIGIALAFALHHFEVKLIDLKPRAAEEYERVQKKAKQEIGSILNFLRRTGHLKHPPEEIGSNISISHDLDKHYFGGGVIFEAIPERPDLKQSLLKTISPHLHQDTIIASTTSTIDLKTLKTGFPHPANLLITHWLNPAFIIPLVEIARTEETRADAVDRMKALLKGIGKVPVVLKDSPGFIVPRIQALAMNEAVRLLEDGVASAEDIDTAITYGLGIRLSVFGLLEFIDMGGLDILYHADQFLSSAFKDDKFKVPRLIEEKMKKGEVGPRAGKGIYDYDDRGVESLFEEKYEKLLNLLRLLEQGGPRS
jgi:3-hydroxybutyryl-CoA dehydrogenase